MNTKFFIVVCLLCFIESYSQKHLKPNSKAPKINITDWVINVPENKDKELTNKYIVLNFLNTIPNENPNYDFVSKFNYLKSKFDKSDLCFLGLYYEKPAEIKKHLKGKTIKTIIATDVKKITHSYYGNKEGDILLPLTVLIDNKGIIKWVGFPYHIDEKIIADFLKDDLVPYSLFEKKSSN